MLAVAGGRACNAFGLIWRQSSRQLASRSAVLRNATPVALHTGRLVHADIRGFFPHECQARAKDETGGRRTLKIMERACSEAGMKVVHSHPEVFDFDQEDTPPGFTGVCLLDASHATSHCYSITGQIALDVFTCGQVCPKNILDRVIVDLKREVADGLQVTHQGSQTRFRDANAGGVRGFMERNYKHFNAAALLEASKGYEEHIDQGGKMLLTLAGAMSTAELGVSVAEMIRQDKVHALCVTGANLEEDVFNLVAHNHYTRIPHWRHLTPEDDEKLAAQGLNRVTDTCIPEDTAVRRLEDLLLREYKQADRKSVV